MPRSNKSTPRLSTNRWWIKVCHDMRSYRAQSQFFISKTNRTTTKTLQTSIFVYLTLTLLLFIVFSGYLKRFVEFCLRFYFYFLILVLVFIDANKKLFQNKKRKSELFAVKSKRSSQADWELWTGHFSHSSLLARVWLGLCTQNTHTQTLISIYTETNEFGCFDWVFSVFFLVSPNTCLSV